MWSGSSSHPVCRIWLPRNRTHCHSFACLIKLTSNVSALACLSCSLKAGKVVIVLNGRMAGKKGLIVKTFDEGTDGRKYGHAIVAGIARAPLKVKKSMSEKKVEKRSRVKPFLKLVNFNHLMPTRFVPSSVLAVSTYTSKLASPACVCAARSLCLWGSNRCWILHAGV